MLKLTCIVKRLPHLSHEEFKAHWHEKHAPLIKKYAHLLGIQRYIQNDAIESHQVQSRIEQLRNLPHSSFDGIAELWYSNLETHLQVRNTEDGSKALQEIMNDENNFIDFNRSYMWYCEERDVI